MGRLEDLKETYIKNIELTLEANIEVEFVLLNWNSPDGLDKWVDQNLNEYMASGIVKYLVNTTATEFSQSKTKNTTLKNSTGDILCTLDADNTINSAFLDILKKHFIYSCDPKNPNPILQCRGGPMAGRMVFKRECFFKLKGFDESMTGWGGEDFDFVKRFCLFFGTDVVTLEEEECGCGWVSVHPAEFNLGAASASESKERAISWAHNEKISRLNLDEGNLAPNPQGWGCHFHHEK